MSQKSEAAKEAAKDAKEAKEAANAANAAKDAKEPTETHAHATGPATASHTEPPVNPLPPVDKPHAGPTTEPVNVVSPGTVVEPGITAPVGATPRPPEPEKHADHASLAVHKKRTAEEKLKRASERERMRRNQAGNLPGQWFLVGNSLIRLDAVSQIDLYREGESPSVTFTSITGQRQTISGEPAEDIMEDLGIKPLPPMLVLEEASAAQVDESGRLRTPNDVKADADPKRVSTVPVGPKKMPNISPLERSPSNLPTAPAQNAKPPEPETSETAAASAKKGEKK